VKRGRSFFLTLTLDVGYIVLALVASVVGLFRGRFAGMWDHLKRRGCAEIPLREGDRPCVWLHGVSVGEVLSARELVQKIAAEFPRWDIVVSSSTRLGVEAARSHYSERIVVSYPLDLSYCVRRAFRQLRPDLIVVVEHDLWPNFLRHAAARGTPVILANARLSPKSLRGCRFLSRVYPWPPRELAAILVQDEASARGFIELGYSEDDVDVVGNLKFDNPPPPQAEGLRAELQFEADDWVLVAGSTHEGEEVAALDALAELRRRDRRTFLILVPRRIERTDEIASLVAAKGFSHSLWSEERQRGPDVLLVDTIGALARISAVGDVVFVGGTLAPVGGHNVIEPAAFGRPIVIGPHYRNARSVVQSFVDGEGLLVVPNADEFVKTVVALKENPERAGELGRNAARTVRENAGAAERVLKRMKEFLQG